MEVTRAWRNMKPVLWKGEMELRKGGAPERAKVKSDVIF